MKFRLLLLVYPLLVTACEIPGLGPDPRVLQREADSKAIGGACRHGLRSIEDCYTLNGKASKADIFTGWKEMDAYMRENKIEGVPATITKPVAEGDIVTEKMSAAELDADSEALPKAGEIPPQKAATVAKRQSKSTAMEPAAEKPPAH